MGSVATYLQQGVVDSVATTADSVETRGTTRRCRYGHICIGAAICNSAVGKPDWATRRSLCLERRGDRVARHFPFDERDVEPQTPIPPRYGDVEGV